jgi:hypothetical protein
VLRDAEEPGGCVRVAVGHVDVEFANGDFLRACCVDRYFDHDLNSHHAVVMPSHMF